MHSDCSEQIASLGNKTQVKMLNDRVGSPVQYYAGLINYQMIADISQIIRSYCADKTESLVRYLEDTVERSLSLADKKVFSSNNKQFRRGCYT